MAPPVEATALGAVAAPSAPADGVSPERAAGPPGPPGDGPPPAALGRRAGRAGGARSGARRHVGQPEPASIVVRLPTPTAAAPVTDAAAPPAVPTPATDPVNPAFNAALLGAVRPVWVEARGQPSQGVFGELFAATTGSALARRRGRPAAGGAG